MGREWGGRRRRRGSPTTVAVSFKVASLPGGEGRGDSFERFSANAGDILCDFSDDFDEKLGTF